MGFKSGVSDLSNGILGPPGHPRTPEIFSSKVFTILKIGVFIKVNKGLIWKDFINIVSFPTKFIHNLSDKTKNPHLVEKQKS